MVIHDIDPANETFLTDLKQENNTVWIFVDIAINKIWFEARSPSEIVNKNDYVSTVFYSEFPNDVMHVPTQDLIEWIEKDMQGVIDNLRRNALLNIADKAIEEIKRGKQ